jgi:hypothetical protein
VLADVPYTLPAAAVSVTAVESVDALPRLADVVAAATPMRRLRPPWSPEEPVVAAGGEGSLEPSPTLTHRRAAVIIFRVFVMWVGCHNMLDEIRTCCCCGD